MNPSNSVSVIIPVLNGADTIGDLLTALTNQSDSPAEVEILVVDNGSQDGSCDIARKFPVVLLKEEKRGPSAARNHGLSNATGNVVAFLDADTLPSRRWLKELTAPFSDPDVIMVGGKLLSYLPETGAQRFYARMGVHKTEYQLSRERFPFFGAGTLAVRRSEAVAIGGFAEDMPTAEDIDFCYRLQQRFPGKVLRQESAILFHRDRASDAALWRQAWSYGEGVADMYRRYPDQASWGWSEKWQVGKTLAYRSVHPLFLHIGKMLGWVTEDRLEFAVYLRRWSWSYWRGFAHMYATGERKVR